jgi:NodT family efflux transporter outer membrane factor (OMF) lipoprotein
MKTRMHVGNATLAVLLAGCAVGPNYQRPAIDMPASFRDGGVQWTQAQPADAVARGAWWAAFNDPQLDALMTQLQQANLDLRVAEARFRQAEALTRQARAARWPVIGADAGITRSRSGSAGSRTTNATGASASAGAAGIGNSASATASLSWELDLWGRVARTVESDAAAAQASAADLASTRLSLQATLAQDYFGLRQADAAQALLASAVDAYTRSLQLTRNRYDAGVASRVDVAQAQTQLETTRSQWIDLGIQRAQFEHAIAVLVGAPASTFAIAPRAPEAALPEAPQVATVVPATLLQRRPDVAAAERRVAAANAQIGVAQAAYFPTLSLGASAGWRSSTLTDLFDAANRVWSLGPTLAATLFDAGARGAARAQAEAVHEQASATYRRTVLGAIQEVEDALVALRVLENEAAVDAAAVEAAQLTLQLTVNQYGAGTVSYLNVITAQTAELSSRRARLDLQGRRLTSTVLLVQALGGGWNDAAAIGMNP